MPDPVTNLEKLRRYLKSIEDGDFSYIAQLFASDSVIEQLPNRICPNGLRAGVSRMAEAFEKGRKLLSSQTCGWHGNASAFRHVLCVPRG